MTGRTDALLGKYASLGHWPKIIYTNSSVEYWGTGRAAALVHTSIDGKTDLTLPANVRVYHFAGTQHGPAAFPPRAALGEWPECPWRRRAVAKPHAAYDRLARALLALDRWVRDGVEPPASKYPRLADSTLTTVDALKWPALPSIPSPRLIPEPRRANGDGAVRRVAVPRPAGR